MVITVYLMLRYIFVAYLTNGVFVQTRDTILSFHFSMNFLFIDCNFRRLYVNNERPYTRLVNEDKDKKNSFPGKNSFSGGFSHPRPVTYAITRNVMFSAMFFDL